MPYKMFHKHQKTCLRNQETEFCQHCCLHSETRSSKHPQRIQKTQRVRHCHHSGIVFLCVQIQKKILNYWQRSENSIKTTLLRSSVISSSTKKPTSKLCQGKIQQANEKYLRKKTATLYRLHPSQCKCKLR